MPSGEMRRPPQLWEQRLARTTAILGAGISSSGDATAIVPPTPAPGAGGGTEPAPVSPPAGAFTTPSKPTLFRQVQGLGVLWDGLNVDGDLWPYDTSWVEIHADTSGSAFTPSDATLKGRLARPGVYSIGGLTQGSTYYVRLRGADPAGNYTAAGAAESAITGGTITAVYISGGTMAAGYLSGGTISGGYITGGTVDGGYVIGGTVEGTRIRTGTSGARVELGTSGRVSKLDFIDSGGGTVSLSGAAFGGVSYLSVENASYIAANSLQTIASVDVGGALNVDGAADFDGAVDVAGQTTLGLVSGNAGLRVAGGGDVFSYGIDGTTTSSAANVRVEQTGARQLVRSTSTQRVKTDIVAVRGDLAGVSPDKVSGDNESVDPWDVLNIAPAEFQSLAPVDQNQRLLGFIAENVAAVFPFAAEWDEDGIPSSVSDRPILAALLAVVRDQQATITALTARIEALEA